MFVAASKLLHFLSAARLYDVIKYVEVIIMADSKLIFEMPDALSRVSCYIHLLI